MNTGRLLVRSIVLTLVFAFAAATQAGQNTLLVVGDSLSAAYGVPTETAWVALLRQRLETQPGDWQVANASISGETTDGGARRLPALLDAHEPEVVIIELGGNDGLRGFPPRVIEDNLNRMVSLAQEAGARVLLVGMQIPPNYGPAYTQAFAQIFRDVSDRHQTALVPFFLEGIYNRDGLMQSDGIHPTEQAQPKLLENLWPHLSPLLDTLSTRR